MFKLLYYYKEQQQELIQNLTYNKTLLEIYNYNKDLQQVKKLLIENIEYYKQLKNANSFILNYKVKEKVYKPIKRVVNTDEDEYDNYAETRQREEFVNISFNTYLSNYDR